MTSGIRDIEISKQILEKINFESNNLSKPITIMHVCGTHEYTVAKNGLRNLLPDNIKIISGPGCPVCVCPTGELDLAIELSKRENVIMTTFGDMMRVPSSTISLFKARAQGHDVRVVYGPNDAVELARKNPTKEVVFFAIGFETTTPSVAFELINDPPSNFSIICTHKTVPPAMDLLLNLPNLELSGFLLPGHVCAIIGAKPFELYAEKYRTPMVVGGFEVNDVLMSLYYILRQTIKKEAFVDNTYKRIVKREGNKKAIQYISDVFEPVDSVWRGIGMISNSGLKIRKKFEEFDAVVKFNVKIEEKIEMPKGCSCDKVLIGNIPPQKCPLFGKSCTPRHPIGPCMVSHEGACKIAFSFREIID
ncbi:hydrogenase formation protein HypD [Promethearchaeum syntrophicum]|uniref:Hydrogenase formation protein HypD n=1 Tax=Promethearchaeum syntrophicum TaxID=2594042 RepID=A0A5B9DG67_9ARCH|nr:hydrogenase formation protein HypD [Candidatus Prometheoarchaeum syntrophicum]QEE18102.1 Hydrogenase formation hypA family protein [Candidatus Prometheoarchaeum syntrophicum]